MSEDIMVLMDVIVMYTSATRDRNRVSHRKLTLYRLSILALVRSQHEYILCVLDLGH